MGVWLLKLNMYYMLLFLPSFCGMLMMFLKTYMVIGFDSLIVMLKEVVLSAKVPKIFEMSLWCSPPCFPLQHPFSLCYTNSKQQSANSKQRQSQNGKTWGTVLSELGLQFCMLWSYVKFDPCSFKSTQWVLVSRHVAFE